MSVAPFKLERVLSDELSLSELKTIWNMNRQNDANPRHFVLTTGTGTHATQPGSQMMRLMPIRPEDHELAGADFFYFRGSSGRCCRTSHYSTSRTGAS